MKEFIWSYSLTPEPKEQIRQHLTKELFSDINSAVFR
jgi:hypothetical protein